MIRGYLPLRAILLPIYILSGFPRRRPWPSRHVYVVIAERLTVYLLGWSYCFELLICMFLHTLRGDEPCTSLSPALILAGGQTEICACT